MKLVVVESPTKAKTLNRFLGRGFQTIASMGHVRDLPKSRLGVDVKNNFQPEYELVPGKKSSVAKLKKQAKAAKKIILATDPDREGEAIAWHIKYLIKGVKKPVKRIVFHEITKSAVKQALEHPGGIDKQRVDAQQARRILDRLVGYQLSPLLWKKIRRGLSAGRVQTPALRLIVEREREIEAFKPQEYWEISVELKKPGQGEKFQASLIKIKGKKAEINNQKKAEKIKEDLEKQAFLVKEVRKRRTKRNPPPPYITSTLQRAGASYFHWSAKKTMTLAQRLYENGLITYHRTDSVSLASSALAMARTHLKKKFGPEYLPEKPRQYKAKSKLAQEAHEAIRPTKLRKIKKKDWPLGRSDRKLYRLIVKRFLACQAKPQVLEKTKAKIEAGDYQLEAKGKKELFDGWRAIWRQNKKPEYSRLPDLKKSDKLKLLAVLPEQKFTRPPARYNEGTLIRALEKRGIGRPSTYAPIISTLKTRRYVEKADGYFQPTEVGKTVNDFLVKHFPTVVDYDFTAQMEDDLDEIAQGEKKWVTVVKDFYQPFAKKLKKVEKQAKRKKIKAPSIGKKCPKCAKGEQVIRIGKYGKFLSCSRFPKCDWTAEYLEKVKGVKCPECGGQVIVRKTKKGKRFYGCVNFPKCKWATWKKPKKPEKVKKAEKTEES